MGFNQMNYTYFRTPHKLFKTNGKRKKVDYCEGDVVYCDIFVVKYKRIIYQNVPYKMYEDILNGTTTFYKEKAELITQEDWEWELIK